MHSRKIITIFTSNKKAMKLNKEEMTVLYEALSDYTCGHPIETDLINKLEKELDITWCIGNE